MKLTVPAVLVVLVVHLFPVVTEARSYPLWGDLEAGPHDVGFRVLEEVDRSRAIRPRGSSSSAHPRPVRVYVWYPANWPDDSRPMAFGLYAEAADEDAWPDELLDGVRDLPSLWRDRNLPQVGAVSQPGSEDDITRFGDPNVGDKERSESSGFR